MGTGLDPCEGGKGVGGVVGGGGGEAEELHKEKEV